MKLTQIAVDNPVFATMMMVALLVMGLFSYRTLGIDQFPNVDFPIVVVTTDYPGASPETVESEISRKIEESVNAIAGLKTLTSRSLEGRSIVIAEFELSVPSAVAMQDVREKVQMVRASFRPEIKEPLIQRFNPDDQPIVSIAVRSDVRSVRDLTTLADQIIIKRLQTVRDVGRATIAGGLKRQINIELDPGRMHALRVGVNDIMRAIKDENQNFPAGNVQRGNDDRVIEVTGRVAEPGDFADLIVARRGQAPVYLRQVANVVDGQQELENVAMLNGERALAIDVVKTQGSNTIEVARGVRRAVAELQSSLPPDVKLEIVRDSSRGIQNSVDNVQQTMIEALDRADHVTIKGMGKNRTDLKIKLHELNDPDKETNFENCVADVNIPVGEVFTSPLLKGTEGLLHVSRVFLNGLEYRDLEMTFTDGMISSYRCGNFASEEENKKYIKDHVLFRHDTLPMGEFAIGTNTAAYVMAKKYGIGDKLPILIAEKMGPHFAVGDTCYSHEEELVTYNPDGKAMAAKENEVSALRHTNKGKAYFNCHTDITIPYDELGELAAVDRDGKKEAIIREGRFVLKGCEALNRPLDE